MKVERIVTNDDIREEMLVKLGTEEGCHQVCPTPFDVETLSSSLEVVDTSLGGSMDLAAIVRRFGRPVLYIQQNVIAQPASDTWRDKVEAARAHVEAAVASIGRIEARNHPDQAWLGTGWLVAPGVLLTNRHVAVEFGRKSATGFTFKRNPAGKKMRARIDFREEHEQPEEDEFRIREILHIEDDDDVAPDLAFLLLDERGEDDQDPPPPLRLSPVDPGPNQTVGVVGYAAWDGRRNDQDVMDRIFEGIYNVKRLHPGEVMQPGDGFFTHDCSTLGGNSGSPVIDFATGEVVGIHFAGSFDIENYAVPASTIRQRMAELGIG